MRRTPSRGLAAALAGCVAALVIAATPAEAARGHYSVSEQSGVGYALLTSKQLVPPAGVDDALFYLSTTASGARHLPFPLKAYNSTFKNVAVSSNGNVQFGVVSPGGDTAFTNTTLAATLNTTKPVFFPFWDDLLMIPSDTSHFFTEGVFVSTRGTAPHRRFIIAWQGHHFNDENYFVLAEATFHEGSQTVQFRYGFRDNQSDTDPNGGFPSETIGGQGQGGVNPFRIFFGNDSNVPSRVTQGTQFTLVHVG
jgi:hypothetical protein